MSIRDIVENTRDLIGDEKPIEDSRTFCKECGRIQESREDRCVVCNSIVGRTKTLCERVMEMSEFGREYPRSPQIIEFISDHYNEFLDREDAINQVGKTFGVSRDDAEELVDAVEVEMGSIVSPEHTEVYASRKNEGDEKFIRSILQDITKEVEGEDDLEKAKQLVVARVRASGIKDIDKKKIEMAVDRVVDKKGLISYIWNSILKYSGLGVIKSDEAKKVGKKNENVKEGDVLTRKSDKSVLKLNNYLVTKAETDASGIHIEIEDTQGRTQKLIFKDAAELSKSFDIDESKELKEQDYITLGTKMSKEDAERLARDKDGEVIPDDEGDEERFSVIKKTGEGVSI